MQSTNKISETIHQIFKIINVVYDPKVISFDSQELTVTKFNQALDLASKIEISNVGKEVWDASEDSLKYESINDIINDRFNLLLTWKPNIYDIVLLKNSLQDDLKKFYDKMIHLGINFGHPYNNQVSSLYIKIGLRLLKVILDLDKIIQELKNKTEIFEKNQIEKMSKAAAYNIKVKPDKLPDFTRQIYKLYYENYFCPLDNKNGITEIEVLLAFEKFFDIDIVDAEWFTPDLMFDDEQDYESETNLEPDFSNEEIIVQLKSFFSNAANEYFIKNLPIEFKIEKGKSMSILLYVLKNFEPCLLNIPYRKAKMFHEILKAHFKRDIGSYQSIFNYKVEPAYYVDEIEFFKKRITPLHNISKHL
jgi:hypothetical protein